jgi:hypothetical protein
MNVAIPPRPRIIPPKLPSKPKRLPKRGSMTIAVGFRCVDGIVLCADTQETRGEYIKKKQPKIEVRGADASPIGSKGFHRQSPCAVFAGAGSDGDLIDVLIEKLWAAMEPKGAAGLEAMIEAAEDELIKQYQRLVPVFPSGVPETTLLVGVWASEYHFDLLKISGPILKRQIMLESIGFGDILATYITGRLIYPKSWISLSSPIGLYVIDQVKLFVEGCGGDTQMYQIRHDGKVEYITAEAAQAETDRLRKIDWTARQMVGLAMQPFESMVQFNALVESEVENLRKLVTIEPKPPESQKS